MQGRWAIYGSIPLERIGGTIQVIPFVGVLVLAVSQYVIHSEGVLAR